MFVCSGGDPVAWWGSPSDGISYYYFSGRQEQPWEKRPRTHPGRVPDASRMIDFEETDASRTCPQPFLPELGCWPWNRAGDARAPAAAAHKRQRHRAVPGWEGALASRCWSRARCPPRSTVLFFHLAPPRGAHPPYPHTLPAASPGRTQGPRGARKPLHGGGCQGNPELPEFPGVSRSHRSNMEHHGAPRSATEHHGAPRSTTEHRGAPRSTTEHHGAPRSTTEYHGALRSTTEHQGAPGSATEHYGAPRSTVKDTKIRSDGRPPLVASEGCIPKKYAGTDTYDMLSNPPVAARQGH
eukprot:gene21535-biopygen13200